MAKGFSWNAGSGRGDIGISIGAALDVALEGAADEVTGTEADGERKGKNDSAEENPESE